MQKCDLNEYIVHDFKPHFKMTESLESLQTAKVAEIEFNLISRCIHWMCQNMPYEIWNFQMIQWKQWGPAIY